MNNWTRLFVLISVLLVILFGIRPSYPVSTNFQVSATVETVLGVKPLVRQPMGLLVASSENEHYDLLLAMGPIERKFSNAVDERTINGKRFWVAHDRGGSLQILTFISGGGEATVQVESELELLPVIEKELIYNVEARPGEIFITVTPERNRGEERLEGGDLGEYQTADLL